MDKLKSGPTITLITIVVLINLFGAYYYYNHITGRIDEARQLYEAALERLTREVAAVDGVEEEKAQVKVGAVLNGKAA